MAAIELSQYCPYMYMFTVLHSLATLNCWNEYGHTSTLQALIWLAY